MNEWKLTEAQKWMLLQANESLIRDGFTEEELKTYHGGKYNKEAINKAKTVDDQGVEQ